MNQVHVKLLPDGSGRVRIHYFIHDEKGPIQTPGSVVPSALGPIQLGGFRGRIACQPGLKSILPKNVAGVLHLTPHSDDVRGVSCPECMASKEYKETKAILAETLDTSQLIKES